MKFTPQTLDYTLSPYTGLTRQSWIEAAEYLLAGIFNHIKSFNDPVVMPRQETEVTYPHIGTLRQAQGTNAPPGTLSLSKGTIWEQKAEYFEGLTRSFFIAAPMIHIKPELTIAGINLRDYYKAHVLRACTPGDPLSVGTYEELQQLSGDSTRTFQQTVETSALVICLWVCQEEIWDTYTKEEKDLVAAFLSGYALGNTVPQNWRLFNMLDMAFLAKEGYPIDAEIMLDHAQSILSYYAGDGWYRDGHSFDYYSCWAFNVYAPLWNLWYGYDREPFLAKRFAEASNKLMESYPAFFDRDGWTNMWGRSNIYRFAAVSPFDANFLLENPAADPGVARRIASGSLMQFLSRDDFLYEGVPTLGFYGQFTPLVQGYSCAESPFWMGKAFLCLHLPEDHPFWTAKESLGGWEKLPANAVKVTTLNGPALCASNHQANGETILRSGKVVKKADDIHGMWNYGKLCYNTKYPWESTPAPGVEAQQYVLTDRVSGGEQRGNVTLWHGEEGGVLYRRQFFSYTLEKESHWIHAMNLADFAVPYGILRADKLRLYRAPISLTLGSYGFPDNGTEVLFLKKDQAQAVVLKGHDHTGREKQMAMTVYDGWDSLELVKSEGTNPDSPRSIVAVARTAREKQYGYERYLLISQVITKESLEDFAEEEIFPIQEVRYGDLQMQGGYGPVLITLRDGSRRTIDFAGIEGNLQL